MMIGEASKSEDSGASLLLSIPEDAFAVISRSLSPSDMFNLTLTCKSLCNLVDSEKIWLVRCEVLQVLPLSQIIQWRTGVSSYKAICRFLVEVLKPLAGIWVAQNPELGNVVFVMPGFLSVVGCRIIPQTVGPLGIEEGRVMWSPVFEIICGFDGSTEFFLHGRDKEGGSIYPGLVTGIEKNCNVLLLEVEPGRSETKREGVPFSELEFSDRRKLLDIVTSHVGVHVLESISGKLFPCSNDDDEAKLLERRTMLLKMHKFGASWKNMKLEEEQLCYNPRQVDITEKWENLDNDVVDTDESSEIIHSEDLDNEFVDTDDIDESSELIHSEDLDNDVVDTDDIDESSEIIHSVRQSFLSSGDTFGIGLKASYNDMSFYEGWPIMPQNRYALYKLPVQNYLDDELYHDDQIQGTKKKSFSKYMKSGIKHILGKSSSSKNTYPRTRLNRRSFLSSVLTFGSSFKASNNKMIQNLLGNELYAGLWGGTFGWPPGKCMDDIPEKALYLLMLTYKESEENSDERVLIGTKILSRHADHPNGSSMFIADIDTPSSLEHFPFDPDEKSFEHSYTGMGISDGYGFRYPGSKPGSLFVISNDLLAFVWKETTDVLTLQRLNLEDTLKKGLGLCISPLHPTNNFTYMERSYGNVFTQSSTD